MAQSIEAVGEYVVLQKNTTTQVSGFSVSSNGELIVLSHGEDTRNIAKGDSVICPDYESGKVIAPSGASMVYIVHYKQIQGKVK